MTCFSLTFNFFDVSLITQVLFFFSPSLSVPTQIVFTVLLKNFTFLPWQRVHILQPFFFFAIPFLIFFPFFRSFAHFTHWFVWSPSNSTFVLFTFYAFLFPFPLFSRPFGRPLIPFSSLLTVQFLAFCSSLFANLSSIADFLFSYLCILRIGSSLMISTLTKRLFKNRTLSCQYGISIYWYRRIKQLHCIEHL